MAVSQNLENCGRLIEFAISVDVAKELSMVENNDKGRQARKYFISCEKKIAKEFIEAISEDESVMGGNLPMKTSRAVAESEEVDTRKVVSVRNEGKVPGTWMPVQVL